MRHLGAQEGDERLADGIRVIDEGPVPGAGDRHDLGAREGLALALCIGHGEVDVAVAPDHEGGPVEW